MTYYYIYKITCTAGSLKDHYYIGQRKCHCLPEKDRYKGSGIVIKDYYKKHPNDYVKEILCYCKDENELNEKEDFYVGDLYDTDPLCLNLCAGGHQPGISEETRQKKSESLKGEKNPMKNPLISKRVSIALKGRILSEEHKNKISESVKSSMTENVRRKISESLKGENHPMYGKHWSEEIIRKNSESNKGKQAGGKNPAAKIIYIDGQKFDCIKYAIEYLNVSMYILRKFKRKHKSGDYYKGHKIEWE